MQDGRILHNGDGAWRFDYDDASEADDETGLRWSQGRLGPGTYVAIRKDDGRCHAYQVISARPA